MIISIDGALGVGKTTLLKELEKKGYNVIYEDLDSWKEYLEKFYENKNKYALALQIKIALSHKKNIEDCKDNEIYFIERGVLSVNNIFGYLLLKENTLDIIEYNLIEDILQDTYTKINHHIILNCSFNETLMRIQNRNVYGEVKDIQYLEKVYQEYNNMILNSNCIEIHVNNKTPNEIMNELLSILF